MPPILGSGTHDGSPRERSASLALRSAGSRIPSNDWRSRSDKGAGGRRSEQVTDAMHHETQFSPEEHHRRGLALLEAGHGPEGFEHLSRAYLSDPQSARYRSSYALALALVRGQFLAAVDLAKAAIRQEFYNPDLYLNLARIYLSFEFKAEAVRFLRRGLMVDPENERVQRKLAELGVRRRPPIRFLPRGHVLNRVLGRAQARLLGPSARWSESRMQSA